MPTSPINEVIQYLRGALRPEGADLTDGQLLECFLSRREPAALEALVRRHGPMVWGVCRRVLQNHHDAEDAFQATFLVLVRKAASIRSGAKVGNWLYGVAHQTALKARATRSKRKMREARVRDMPEPAVKDQDPWNDLQALLDQAVSRLPEKYRTVIVLCELEGKTVKEAARQLGCPGGTVASRLARARTMLAKRLARHGPAVTGGALAAVMSEKAAASVPTTVLPSTIKAVTSAAAGQAAATGVISGTVAALTQGVIKAMLLNKLLKVTAVLLVVAALGGATGLIYRTQAAEPGKEQEANEKPSAPKTGATGKEKSSKGDLDKLQGTWRLVRSEMDGIAFGEDRPEIKDTRLVIDKSSITMSGTVIYDPRIKKEPEHGKAVGTFTVDTKKAPKQIIITWKITPWLTKQHVVERGIYALEGDSLKLCFSSDTKFLVPTEFSASAGSKRNLGTWKRVPPSGAGSEKKPQEGDTKPPSKDLGKIQPPGGVPLIPGGVEITGDMVRKTSKRLEVAPGGALDKWVVELERIMDEKLDGDLAKQGCRTYFVNRMSVAFDDLKWNAESADNLFKRAQTMPPSEAKAWKKAFEALLKKEIGQTDKVIYDGGPAYAVPLVLIPVDALHEGQKYSVECGKKYLARLKQLTADDVALWRDKVDKFGGTELDAAVNIILLDDYFHKEKLQRDKLKAAIEQQQEKKKGPAKETGERDKLQGAWQLVSLEFDGLGVGEGRPELKDTRLLIEQKSLTLLFTPETVIAESATRKAIADFTLDAEQTPKVIVLTWKECPWNGKKDFVRKAIYAVAGDTLKLCLNRKDDDKGAPTEFSAKTGSERLLWTFRRDRTSPERSER